MICYRPRKHTTAAQACPPSQFGSCRDLFCLAFRGFLGLVLLCRLMNTGKKYRGRGIFPPSSSFFSPYTRHPLPVCVSKGHPFVWDPNWPSLSDGSRPVSAGRKVTALFESRLRTEPRKVKPASTDQLACDFQEPAAVSQATLEPAILRWEKLLGDKARLITCGTEISMKSSAECVAIPSRYCID